MSQIPADSRARVLSPRISACARVLAPFSMHYRLIVEATIDARSDRDALRLMAEKLLEIVTDEQISSPLRVTSVALATPPFTTSASFPTTRSETRNDTGAQVTFDPRLRTAVRYGDSRRPDASRHRRDGRARLVCIR
jgi:hypothetical protein